MIPQANVRNLMLRPDVVGAIRGGQFHVYPVAHVDQGLELLTGMPAGNVETPDTIHYLVNTRLQQLAQAIMAFGDGSHNGTRSAETITADTETTC
ncbi:MAG TPA: hypothetical protein VIH59_08560 [Candidatus Tectomicrobia bacterium]|jgi:predicted ATP-dependent protease